MKSTPLRVVFCLLTVALARSLAAAAFDTIVVAEKSPPAVTAAARILARDLKLPETAIQTLPEAGVPGGARVIVLVVAPVSSAQSNWLGGALAEIQHDGYAVAFRGGGALVCGVRPRSLLFAAGDVRQWQDRANGVMVRDPSFAVRTATFHGGGRSLAEYVATLGINRLIGSRAGTVTFQQTLPEIYQRLVPADQARLEAQARRGAGEAARFAQECRDADVEYFPFLYGNNFQLWSPTLYDAVVRAHPSARGTPASNSWEKASLCPSDPATWQAIEAYVKEFAARGQGDGLYVTFWDNYGLYCQCERCVASGMNQFSNQLATCVGHYRAALVPLGKHLVVRTWSSGVPHWLGEQWVHAPGYDNFGGPATNLWGPVIRDVPADVTLQTKVYHADCQPDARFSPLLGHAAPHAEIAEYQITGQTTGRFYFPASTVDHTAWTMRRSYELLGPDGGVSLFPGGTQQSNYNLLDDACNSINVYSWRELSWDVNANVEKIWLDWAVPIFGAKAAPHIVKALRLSERVVNRLFSTLGLGSDTNSGFAGSIQRRETLLKYTNRYFLPEGIRNLEPTPENVQRVLAEKDECLRGIDEMARELELARPDLPPPLAAELTTRLDWLREFAVVARALDESLWRYRYLRFQAGMLTTDPEQMQHLAQAYDTVKQHRGRLFRFDPAQQFSGYGVPLGQLARRPSLGNPMPLMQELYDESRAFVEGAVGPDYLPAAWKR